MPWAISVAISTITDVRCLTLDTAEGVDASVSTIAQATNLRPRKAPICLALSGNMPCEVQTRSPQNLRWPPCASRY